MKILKISLISLAVALFVFACSQTKTTETNTNTANVAVVASNSNAQTPATAVDELAAARKTYAEVCIKCHKEGGVGGTTEIDDVKIKVPNFTSEKMMKHDTAHWSDAIENGIKDEGMPAFKGRLTEQEIEGLVKMIQKDFQKK